MADKIYLLRGNDTPLSVCLRKREGDGDPVPYDLSEAERVRLALTGHGLSFFARDIVVSGEDNNIISGLLAGDLLVGEYGLEVSFTLDGKAKRFRVPQVFEVVTYLSEDQDGTAEGEGDGISITVTVQPEVIEIAGPTGPRGHDGKSVYEVWLDEGHTGTEDDFFRWLAAQTPNPDWAQNDASEPDYVENRTHYDIPAVSLPDAFITFRWTEEDYSDLMFYLNDETPMPRVSENVWGVQLGQWLLSCYINGNILEVDLDGDPILTVANFRPGRTPQPIPVGDIEVPELVQQLDGKYLALKTVNGQSVKGSGDITLNGGDLEYTGNDGEYISGGESINGSLLLLDEAVDETNGRLNNLKGSEVVYDGEDGDSVIVHGDTVDQCLKGLDDQAAYIIENYQYKISDLDTIREGAAAGATAYQKPSTGIPKSALASAVKTSLEKADTALQPADLNGYATEEYVDDSVAAKQDTLISGENIKTINGQSVLGSGDIQTGGGSADAVKYTEQELTEAQQEQARDNIGAASESEVSQLRSEVFGERILSVTESGYYIRCDAGVGGTVGNKVSNGSYCYIKENVNAGDKIIITGVGASQGRLWCFADSSDKILSSASAGASATRLELVAPENTAYIIINSTIAGLGQCVVMSSSSVVGDFQAEITRVEGEIDSVRGEYPDIEGEARNKWYLDSEYRYQDVSVSVPTFTGSIAIFQIDGASSVIVDIPMVYAARAVAFDNAIPQSGAYAAAHQDLPANQAYSGTLTNPGNYKYLILCYVTANGIPTVKGGTRVGGSEEALAIAKELQADAKLNIISVDDLYVAKGVRQKFYYNTFIHARENAYGNILDGFSVDAACATASIGTTDEEGFEIYYATNGDYVVNFTVMDLSQNVVAAFPINVHVRDANNLTGKNILMVGDSWTDPSFYNPSQYPTGKGYAVNTAMEIEENGSIANFVGSKFAGNTDIYCEGRGGWAWTTYVGSSSPFYNNGAIDFSHYRSEIGLAGNFDYVSFQLGVNDCLGNRKSTSDWQTTLEAITTLINAVLADSPSCKVIINPVGLDAPGKTGWTSLNGLSVNKHIYQANAYDLSALVHDLVTARADYGTKVFMGQSYFGVNRWYGYGYIDGRKRFFKVDTASMSAADLATLEGWDFKTNPKYVNNGQKEWHAEGYEHGYLICVDQCAYQQWNLHIQQFVNQYSIPQDTTPAAGTLVPASAGSGFPDVPFTACVIENNDLLSHYFMNATHPYDYGFTQLGRCLANQLLVI